MATVSIVWSITNGGVALSSVLDAGSKANGETTDSTELFLRHNGSNVITAVGLYVREYTGTYSGGATSSADIAELISWGDASTANGFGGLLVNMDAVNSYATAQWPVLATKDTTYGFVCRTGVGDSEGNAVTLSKNSYSATGTDGEVPVGSSPNVRFAVRIAVPNDEDTLGIRQVDFMATYSFTS
jgi:hypothetical protein